MRAGAVGADSVGWVRQFGRTRSGGRRFHGSVVLVIDSFHLASASVDEHEDGLDEVGHAHRTAADLAEDPPRLELRIGAFPRPRCRAWAELTPSGWPTSDGVRRFRVGGPSSLRGPGTPSRGSRCRRSPAQQRRAGRLRRCRNASDSVMRTWLDTAIPAG